MSVASLVLGIISLILAFVPFCGYLAFVPALIGLILGIVDVVKKGKTEESKGQGIAGIVLNTLAIIVIILWTLVFAASAAAANEFEVEFEQELEQATQDMAQEMEEAAAEIDQELGN